MTHKCFISFKKEDTYYKDKILEKLGNEEIIGKSLDKWIDSDDIDYVMQTIRKNYMSGTSVTLFLIGEHSSENEGNDDGGDKNAFIKRELQATLYDGKEFRRSGLLGIVLPEMVNKIYLGERYCSKCGENHRIVNINDDTVIREFSVNYYLKPSENSVCGETYNEDGKFCVLVEYSDFLADPEKYINKAYDKLNQPICDEVHWRNLR